MESNSAWMTETVNSFHVALSLCHTSSTALAGEGWWASLRITHDQMFSLIDRSGDSAAQSSNQIPCVSRKARTRRTKCCLTKIHLNKTKSKSEIFCTEKKLKMNILLN